MTGQSLWREAFEGEIERAEAARLAGNEGMARVCARRAAGIAIREFLARRGTAWRSPSAYALLHTLQSMDDLPAEAILAAERLLMRVTPEFSLPIQADLIIESRRLAEALLDERPKSYK